MAATARGTLLRRFAGVMALTAGQANEVWMTACRGLVLKKEACWAMRRMEWIKQRLQLTRGLQNGDGAGGKIQQLPQQLTGPVKSPWPLPDLVAGDAIPGPQHSAAQCAAQGKRNIRRAVPFAKGTYQQDGREKLCRTAGAITAGDWPTPCLAGVTKNQ